MMTSAMSIVSFVFCEPNSGKANSQQPAPHSTPTLMTAHLPPHSPPDNCRPLPKLPGLGREAVGLVDEELYPLAPAQDGVDVPGHDRLDAVQLGLGFADRVAWGVVGELCLGKQQRSRLVGVDEAE